jgi:hypothetical protein
VLRSEPHAYLPGETPEERAARLACIGQRLARSRAQERHGQVEDILRRGGFYSDGPSYPLTTAPWLRNR